MRARCRRKTQHQELITGGDEIRFVASLEGGGREKGMEEGLCDSFRYSIVIQLSVLSPDDHRIPRYRANYSFFLFF